MLTKRAMSTLLTLVMFFTIGGVTTACGDDGPEMTRPKDPRRKKSKSSGDEVDPTAEVTIQLTKPRWQVLEPHFRKLLKQENAPAKDIFAPQVLQLIPRPELPKTEEDDDEVGLVEVEAVVEVPKGPLEQYSLRDYDLMLVMSGTAMAKAVVTDPSGNAFVIQVEDRLGSGGGIVEAISQYTLTVREPNTDDPYLLSIEPPFANLATRADSSSGGGSPAVAPQMLSAPGVAK